jgi:hypothetical protein
VVELTEPGEIDLGELTLPFWDLKSRAYGVARAALGQVKVTGTAPVRADTQAASSQRLLGLVAPPAELGPYQGGSFRHLTDRPAYWGVLLGLPLSLLLGFALSDIVAAISRRLAARRGSLTTALDEALVQLNASSSSASDVAGAAERALFISIEKATGVKGRGVLKTELSRTLRGAGVAPELAERAADLLGRCDELRFAGEAIELSSFIGEVRDTCQRLAGRKARKAEPSPS